MSEQEHDWLCDEKIEDDAREAEAADRLYSAGHRLDCETFNTRDDDDCDCGLYDKHEKGMDGLWARIAEGARAASISVPCLGCGDVLLTGPDDEHECDDELRKGNE